MNLDEIIHKPIVYTIAGMEHAQVKHNLTYHTIDEKSLKCDVYYPAQFDGKTKLPVVILVHGDANPGVLTPEMLDNAKDWGGYVSTGQLIAASGMIAIPFNHRSAEGKVSKMWEVAEDIQAMVNFVNSHHEELMAEKGAVGVWAWSDGVPYLSALLTSSPEQIKCLVAYYGVMDLQPFISTLPDTLPEAQRKNLVNILKTFSLINLLQEKSKTIPPMLIAKACLDNPFITNSIDSFVSNANTQGVSVELLEHAEGHHGFDSIDEQDRSREIVKATIDFLRKYLVDS